MVRSEPVLIVALLVIAASCSRHPDEDRAKTVATQRSAQQQRDKARNETMDKAGAPRNEAGAPDRPRKEGDSP